MVAQPGPGRIKLFREPADLYLPNRLKMGYWNPLGEKMIFEPSSAGNPSAHPLKALYYLDRAEGELERPRVRKLLGVELRNAILSSSMDTRIQLPKRLERQFRFAERIAKEVPFFRLTYSRNFSSLPDVANLIFQSAFS